MPLLARLGPFVMSAILVTMGWQADLEEAVLNKLEFMSAPANPQDWAAWLERKDFEL